MMIIEQVFSKMLQSRTKLNHMEINNGNLQYFQVHAARFHSENGHQYVNPKYLAGHTRKALTEE